MYIAQDTSGTYYDASSSDTTITYSNYPMAVTTTGILWVAVRRRDSESEIMKGVTFNGVSMTLLAEGTASFETFYLFYLLGASGTHDIVVTLTSGSSNGILILAASYTGVKQTSNPDANGTASTVSGNSITGTIIPPNNGDWIIFLADANSSTSITTATNGVIRAIDTGVIENVALLDSNGLISPPQSYSITASFGVNSPSNWGGIIASFQSAVPVPYGVQQAIFM